MSEICKKDYMPYYKLLKLEEEFWINKYEPVRKGQSEQQKLSLAASAKLINRLSSNGLLSHPSLHGNVSPHHNESINLDEKKLNHYLILKGKKYQI